MKKRLFALLLVLCYAVSLLPLAALAEGDAPAENTPDVKVEVVLASEDGGSAPAAIPSAPVRIRQTMPATSM